MPNPETIAIIAANLVLVANPTDEEIQEAVRKAERVVAAAEKSGDTEPLTFGAGIDGGFVPIDEKESRQMNQLLRVAEAAADLFRPPNRPFAGIQVVSERSEEQMRALYEALNHDDCPVEIGEELT